MAKKLLFSITMADCDLDTFSVGGNGGSGKDTSNTGVRITHRASGAVGEGREERSQLANKRNAWAKMARSPKMQTWLKLETARRSSQPSVDDLVDALMTSEKLKIETRNAKGQWEVTNEMAITPPHTPDRMHEHATS